MSDHRSAPSPARDEFLAAVERRLGERADAVGEAVGRAARHWVVSGRCADPRRVGDGSAQTMLIAGGLGAACGPLEAFCAVADALPEVGAVVVPSALADRVAPPSGESDGGGGTSARLTSLAAAFAATGKHLLTSVADAREVRAVAEMASAAAAGAGLRQESPLVTIVTGSEPPGVGAAIAAARTGLPHLVWAHPTPAAIADALTTVAAVQEQVPGAVSAVAVRSEPSTPLDVGPLSDLACAVPAVRAFGVPLVAEVLSTGAETPGWRSSAENTAAALIAWSAGADAVAGAGRLAAGAVLDTTSLALDAEIASYVTATCAGIAVDDEALAVEVIERVGIGGNYLGERHTRRHMRDVWRSRFFDRSSLEQWKREGRPSSVDLAAAFVQKMVDEQHVDPLDPVIVAEFGRIVRDAARQDPGEPLSPPKETP